MKRKFFIAVLFATMSLASFGQKTIMIGSAFAQGNNVADIQKFEAWEGKKQAVTVYYVSWGSDTAALSKVITNVWAAQNVLMTTIEPHGIALADIAAGKQDAWLDSLVSMYVKAHADNPNLRSYIRFAHEMNGGPAYSWAQQSPFDYVRSWWRVWDRFRAAGLDSTQVAFVWCPLANDAKGAAYRMEDYYPRDAYVDWIGVDIYPWEGSATSPTKALPQLTFEQPLNRLAAISTKPIMIPEWGVSTSAFGLTPMEKSFGIIKLFEYLSTKPQVRAAFIWNRDLPAKDYAVFTPTRVDDGYRIAVKNNNLVGVDVNNPRLLTDEQFWGR
jgi:mannan endo-1,4-beta-mannosidase